jgi:hypothetical protein
MGTMTANNIRKWLAFGTGVGIEIGPDDLRVVVTRVRPTGTQVLGTTTIEQFRTRSAADWGADYARFMKKLGGAHLAAAVLLPRRDVIVRVLNLPGVEDRDLASAIGYQIDSLHPYPEEDAAYAWARVGKGQAVLVALAQRAVVARYAELLEQAGIKVSSFTFTAAAIHSALRLLATPPAGGFLTVTEDGGGTEVYGESPAHPVFSALFDQPAARAQALSVSQLRLPPETVPVDITELLPVPRTAPADFDLARQSLTYATSLAGACPRLSLPVNLLPAEQRSSSSRMIYAPTAVLASAVVILGAVLATQSLLENRRQLAAVEAEIARLEPLATRTMAADRAINRTRARAILLDSIRRRGKSDLDVLGELTRLLPPPAWVNSLEITRDNVTLAGEIEQAAALLKTLDESRLFRNSEFTSPIARTGTNEVFRVRTVREGGVQ